MKISIAGAGAGKTTKISDKIIYNYENSAEHLNIYCIAFTNNAAECIRNKLSKHFGMLPARIKVSTIHSFLYQEIIRPYFYLLYGKHYDKISNVEMPEEAKTKNWKIMQMDKADILHVTVIPQRAKWVIAKRSGDRKREKDIRKVIQSTFVKYCGTIYIDEAQDIDGEFLEVLIMFESMGIEIELMGDPKQDLKGFGNLRKLLELYPKNVEYITECHRCPQKHLILSNTIVLDHEKQSSQKTQGTITVVFESDGPVQKLIDESKFDLKYISAKNERFETHNHENASTRFELLNYELQTIFSMMFSDKSKIAVARYAYYIAGKLIDNYQKINDARKTMKEVFSSTRLNKQDYVTIIQTLQMIDEKVEEKIYISSIESIKGQEGYNCLFVLTTDLAEYLLIKKTNDNKTKHKLYVALTRSLEKLTILVSTEVEEKYGRELILKYIRTY